MEAPKSLIDEKRIAEVTEVGLIEGGDWSDVLAVSYGPTDVTIRVRFEMSGERWEYGLPEGMTLAETLGVFAESLYRMFPYDSKPAVTIYRGRQARKWVKRLIARVERAAEEAKAAGSLPEIEGDGQLMPRLRIDMPQEPSHWFN